MSGKVIIVNTHDGENPGFVGPMKRYLDTLGIENEIRPGYEGVNPLEGNPSAAILTGVPMDVDYSLSQPHTQRLVEEHFGWVRESESPVLGICYGIQILAHVYGGQVSTLPEMVMDERFPLELSPGADGIFSDVRTLKVFAEHKDYVSMVPDSWQVVSQKNGLPYIIYNPQRAMCGMQFVPEQSDGETKEVLRRFLEA